MSAPDLVLLGNLLVDDVVLTDGTVRMAQPGGALLHAAHAAALWGARVGVVSVRGTDYPESALTSLSARGVDLAGVRALEGPGVRAWLLHEGAVRRIVHRMGCPSHEAVSPVPEDVPLAWRRARAFHLAPMPMECQRALVTALRAWQDPASPAFVSLDPHVPVTPETLDAWRALLAEVDAFLPGEDELRLPGVEQAPERTLAALVSGRLRWVFAKRGPRGGLVYDAHERRLHEWPAVTPASVEPTGAGDAFAAGFVTARLEGLAADEALRRAAVSAAFALSGDGHEGIRDATRERADALLERWRRLEESS